MVVLGQVLIAHVEGGDTEVGKQVLVLFAKFERGGEGLPEQLAGPWPVTSHHMVEAQQQFGEAPVPGRRSGGWWRGKGDRVDTHPRVTTEGSDRHPECGHLAGADRVVGSDLARRLEDHAMPQAYGAGVPLHSSSQADDVRQEQRIPCAGSRRIGQLPRTPWPAGQPGSAGRVVEPLSPGLLACGELGGAFPRRRSGLVPASTLGSLSRVHQVIDHGLVGLDRRRGSMPSASVGVLLAAERLCECGVCRASVCSGGRGVQGGSHQGVPHHQVLVHDAHQPGPLDLGEYVPSDTHAARGLEHRCHARGVIGGGHQEEPLRLWGQPSGSVQEDPLHTRGHGEPPRQWRVPTKLFGAEHLG